MNTNKHKLFKDRTGEVHKTKQGYLIKIVQYNGTFDCDIEFLYNGHRVYKVEYWVIKSGSVKNPYHPSLRGVGYLGVGEHMSYKNGKCLEKYNVWNRMLSRCYNEDYHTLHPTYKDVIVCEEWHNFQNFAQWYEDNYKPEYMKGWHLDKDILFKGNKIYSSETCCFVPREINSLFISRRKKRGVLPIGVSVEGQKYCAKVNIKPKHIRIGAFNTPEEAFKAYKVEKEKYIKEMADKWKDLIDPKVYDTLYNYKVEIDD